MIYLIKQIKGDIGENNPNRFIVESVYDNIEEYTKDSKYFHNGDVRYTMVEDIILINDKYKHGLFIDGAGFYEFTESEKAVLEYKIMIRDNKINEILK